MTFRDDHDALFERAESLRGEVDELRRENEELRRENAAFQRENEELRHERATPEATPEPEPVLAPLGDGENPDRIRRALAVWWFPVLFVPMYLLFVLAFYGTLVLVVERWGGGWVGALGMMLGFPLVYFGLLNTVRALEVQAERRWLVRVAVPFDHAAYVQGLAAQHDRRTVRLTLTFSRKLTPEERERVTGIARGNGASRRAGVVTTWS